MGPTRLSIVTFSIWNTKRWDVREPALRQFVSLFNPDLLCLQELRAETQACLDKKNEAPVLLQHGHDRARR